MQLTDELIRSFAKITNDTKRKTDDSAKGTVVIQEGTTFVQLDGSEVLTPVEVTAGNKNGDRVLVSIKNHKATILGNYTDPSATNGSVTALAALTETVQGLAQAAGEAADAAQGSANAAQGSADAAGRQATRANKYADAALNQLGVVQDVIGVLDWASTHCTFTLTADETVQNEKVYFTYDSVTHDYTPVISPIDSELSTYYEMTTVDEAVQDYILSHLAVTNRGLWILPFGINTGSVTPASGETEADARARLGSNYKVLLSNSGMIVYDGAGVAVATYSESIQFDSSRPQYIGGEDAYIEFYDSDHDDVPDSIRIGGNKVFIGSDKKLSDVLTSFDGLEIGGRNLIHNTNVIDLTSNNTRPNINGDSVNGYAAGAAGGTFTAAEHGVRHTVTTAARPGIVFGQNNVNIGLHGLATGRTYTLSFDYTMKTFSGTPPTTSNYRLRAYLGYVPEGSSTYNTNTYKDIYVFYTSDLSDRGAEISGHGEFTFDLPEGATAMRFWVTTNSTNTSYYASGDFFELRNIKLEEGNIATAWTPAPEDATYQYFWHDANGAHIGTVEGDGDSGYNSLWNSNGLRFRNGVNNLAAFTTSEIQFYDGTGNADSNIVARFGPNGSTIGKTDRTKAYMLTDYHSIQLVSKEGTPFFHVSDLRDSSGEATVSETFWWDGVNENFTISVTVVSVVSVTVNNVTYTNYTFDGDQTVTINGTESWTGEHKIVITYTTQTIIAKAYTLGIRDSNETIGLMSFATGRNTAAIGYASSAFGSGTKAFGRQSIAVGYLSTANGASSFAGGQSTASGVRSFSFGLNTSANAYNSAAFGNGTIAEATNQFVVGQFNEVEYGSSRFVVGIGTSNSNRKNALSVYSDGTVRLNYEVDVGGALYVNGRTYLTGHLNTDGTVYSVGSVYTGGKTSSSDGVIGAALGQNGHLYLVGETYCAIYFFRDAATSYTNYISESAAGKLRVQKALTCGSVTSYTPTWTTSPNDQTPVRYQCVESAGLCSFWMMGAAVAHNADDVICTLPTGARPSAQVVVPFIKMTGGVVGTITISTGGVVTVAQITNTSNTGRIYFNCTYPVV